MLHDGFFAEKYNDKIMCFLCPHHCVIANEQFGLCSVRTNKEGVLKTINYGEITAIAVDPIEKKPLYHFKPTKNILSVGSFGCNFSCGFCQNYSIAHYRSESEYVSCDQLIEKCVNLTNNTGIAFTYNEPSIWYEYVYETSKKLKEGYTDLNVVLVTNGYIETEPLLKLLPYVDAMNIDLKSFEPDYYKKICSGNFKAVLDTIQQSYRRCHMEITTLLVNGLNDSEKEVEKIASYLGNLDKDIPLHLSRYFPTYKMDRPPTEIDVMLRAKDVAEKYLNYVYLGNIADVDNSTYCPQCGELIIERNGFSSKVLVSRPACPECGSHIKILL
ncbi:AmmeMemoRadiSam system radical SAM enzyme [Petroclostridium sp. X23]|uniref:AmmeMemoRadiSam system radical SAM enzyme n=1 Tax=Petroclostridium sp. X23 TaxID=3045146 RepID=UPI0024ADDCFA|nr:AmmeMemoRadiSam system radical SAM enzyme [Petroclostridium sp. X23]WHH59330.1 AmmeMemoRadiSam system radical SAM enzyme [Petroclostridium sp. X23]